MIKIKITNDTGAVLMLPMIVSQWGNPEFTDEDGARLISHTNDKESWHDVTYVCYDGGQMSHSFEPDEESIGHGYKKYSYEITLNDKPCTANELFEYCDTYGVED